VASNEACGPPYLTRGLNRWTGRGDAPNKNQDLGGLQDIPEVEARAEGIESVEAYKALSERINGRTKGAR
jgi:hypothetical protein